MRPRSLGFAAVLVIFVLSAAFAWAEIEKGPYLQNVTQNSIEVVWQGSESGTVDWGVTPNFGRTIDADYDLITDMNHAELTGLTAETLYYYQVDCDGEIKTGTFITAPEPGTPFVFAVSGDTRTDHTMHRAMAERILGDGIPDMYFNTGDLVEWAASLDNWADFFAIEADLMKDSVFWPVMGNHDYEVLTFYDQWFSTGRSYAFNYGNAKFIVLNTDGFYFKNSSQYNMLKSELEKAANDPDLQFKFVFFHKPGVTSGSHAPDQTIVNDYLDLFEQFDVDVVFNGHNHIYEHGLVNGVHYLVTGGGGVGVSGTLEIRDWTVYAQSVNHYCRIEVEPDRYTVTVIDVNGNVIDAFTETTAGGGFPGPTPPDLTNTGCGAATPNEHGPDKEDRAANLATMISPLAVVLILRKKKNSRN